MSPDTDVDSAILEAAEEHFATNGFHETIVADIADDANVGKGTVYRHFGNKSELFGTLVGNASDRLKESLRKIRTGERTRKEAVHDIVSVHFDFFEEKRHLVEVVVKEGLERTGDEMETVLEKFADYRSVITSILDTVDDGTDRLPPANVQTQLLLSWVWGLLRDRIIFGLENDAELYSTTMVNTFVEGLKNHAAEN